MRPEFLFLLGMGAGPASAVILVYGPIYVTAAMGFTHGPTAALGFAHGPSAALGFSPGATVGLGVG